jgi:SAM-dependent methyltransferase
MSPSIEAGPIGAARRDLVTTARGSVLDLGSGIGLNLAHLGPGVTKVHVLEPDPHMVRRLRPKLPEGATLHVAGAEAIPLPDGSVDTVLATLTLCTVKDLPTVTAEISRVLRPGGRVLILEHVLSADPRLARWQRRLRRPWGWVNAGCNPARDTAATLQAGGFDVTRLHRFSVPGMPITREWLTGDATITPAGRAAD